MIIQPLENRALADGQGALALVHQLGKGRAHPAQRRDLLIDLLDLRVRPAENVIAPARRSRALVLGGFGSSPRRS